MKLLAIIGALGLVLAAFAPIQADPEDTDDDDPWDRCRGRWAVDDDDDGDRRNPASWSWGFYRGDRETCERYGKP
jgi:hypothetical protein